VPAHLGLRGWVRRRPVTAFCVWVLGLGWPLTTVPVLVDHGLLLGPRLPLPAVVLLVTYGVMLPAALTVTACVHGGPGVRRLLARASIRRVDGRGWLLAVVGLPGLTLLLGVTFGGTVRIDLSLLAGGLLSAVTALVLIHLTEELVWAGFLQSTLARRTGVVRAALLTAVPFAAIHLPLAFLGTVTPRSVLLDLGGLCLLAVVLRLLVGVGLTFSAGSALAAAVLHAVFNASNNDGGLLDHVLSRVDQGLLAPLAGGLLVTVGLTQQGRGLHHPPPIHDRDALVPGDEPPCPA
jgi:membrane protease YdiL (CAAX protease family)